MTKLNMNDMLYNIKILKRYYDDVRECKNCFHHLENDDTWKFNKALDIVKNEKYIKNEYVKNKKCVKDEENVRNEKNVKDEEYVRNEKCIKNEEYVKNEKHIENEEYIKNEKCIRNEEYVKNEKDVR